MSRCPTIGTESGSPRASDTDALARGGAANFRLRVPGERPYRVVIARTPKAMRDFAVSLRESHQSWARLTITGDYRAAFCMPDRPSSERPVILFCRRFFNVGYVAHELTHAASYHLEVDRGMRPGSRRFEEALATTLGDMVRDFWRAYQRAAS